MNKSLKIKYDLSNNYFKYFNEANGVSIKKKLLLKKDLKLETATKIFFKYFIILFIISIILITFYVNSNVNIYIIFGKIFLFVSFLSLYIILLIYIQSKSKQNSQTGEITIDENGISDKSIDNKKISMAWENIELVAVTKNTITILTNFQILFILEKKNKDKIIELIKNYSNVKIIDN